MLSVLELKVPPPLVALAVGVGMWFAAPIGPSLALPFALRVALLVAIALGGGAIALAGDIEFRRAKTTINPLKPQNAKALVTSGVYRYTRNPMYVGLTLVLIGWAAFLCAAPALPGPVALVLYLGRFQIAPEERALSTRFGDAYTQYVSRVPRWL